MDLTTRYLGLTLKNPLVASASPMTLALDNIRRLEDCGTAAVVLPSFFEEAIEAETAARLRPTGTTAAPRAFFPGTTKPLRGSHEYLELVRRAREAVAIPVIASLNGIDPAGWNDYARLVEQAGARAIELNCYFIPADVTRSALEVEGTYLAMLQAVKAAVSIPVAVKLSPYFSAIGAMAQMLANGGADGLVLFNRFYQPDIDLVTLRLSMTLDLSTPAEIRLPLRWIAILYKRLPVSLAASTGVDTADEVLKYVLAGADAVMTTSSLLRYGVEHMRTLLDGLTRLLSMRGAASLDEIRGCLSQRHIGDPTAFARANYIKILEG